MSTFCLEMRDTCSSPAASSSRDNLACACSALPDRPLEPELSLLGDLLLGSFLLSSARSDALLASTSFKPLFSEDLLRKAPPSLPSPCFLFCTSLQTSGFLGPFGQLLIRRVPLQLLKRSIQAQGGSSFLAGCVGLAGLSGLAAASISLSCSFTRFTATC